MSYTNEQHDLGEDAVNNEFIEWLNGLAATDETPNAPFESFNEVAKKTGVPRAAISRMRSGDTPSLLHLKRFASFFRIDLAELQRMAGILPTEQGLTPEEAKRQLRIKQVLNVYTRLPEEDQVQMVEVATIMAGLSDNNRSLLVSMARNMAAQEAAAR